MKIIPHLLTALIFLALIQSCDDSNSEKNTVKNWNVANLLHSASDGVQIFGNPEALNKGSSDFVLFDGLDDGLKLDSMPLAGLSQFTIEIIFRPDTDGNFEQRFFHCGEISGPRVLFELRALESQWYFDGFVKSENDQLALIDSTLLHPLNEWHHAALTVDNGKMTTYVNGNKELTADIEFSPIITGKTSIGVRLNEVSWFKGAIFKIRITPKVLEPEEFMKNTPYQI